jgi:hypothetical protein
MPPRVAWVLAEFDEFWAHLRRARQAGVLRTQIVHRIREEWPYWWASVEPARREQLLSALQQLTPLERVVLRQRLVTAIEQSHEPEPGAGDHSTANGKGAADWVFMQLAHTSSIDEVGLFDEWRLDRVNQGPSRNRLDGWTGFNVLCVNPDEPFPVIVVPLARGPRCEHDYRYNAILDEPAGVACAMSSVRAALTGNPFMFHGRPRGISHLPATMYVSFVGALVVGPIAVASLYIGVATGRASNDIVDLLVRIILACAVLLPALWLLAVASDWRIDRRLVKLLDDSQIAWALGRRLPDKDSRNELRLDGESYAAALAMSLLWSLVNCLDGSVSWISCQVRCAGERAALYGVTGKLSAAGVVLPVDKLEEKKAICARYGLEMLSPPGHDASSSAAPPVVHQCSTLSGLIWIAARRGSGWHLWFFAVLISALLLFAIASFPLVLPRPELSLEVQQNPIFEAADRRNQALLLRFRTSCPSCFVVRVHSKFWKVDDEKPLIREGNGDLATFSTVLTPREDPIGDTLNGSIEIVWQRRVLWLPLPPQAVEEITFATLRDIYERTTASGNHALPHD